MTSQLENAKLFKSMHSKSSPLILFNIWDVGTATALSKTSTRAIGTSSWSVAASHGYEDEQKMPFELILEHVRRIIKSVNMPVTIDIEAGYGHTPNDVQEVVRKIILAGAVGINIEDQNIGRDSLYSCAEQCARIKAAKNSSPIPIFINARTDVFLKTSPDNHTDELLEEALLRMHAYADAGADGFFVPGLKDEALIRKICRISDLPINIMVDSTRLTSQELTDLGVSRVSYGPAPYIQLIKDLKNKMKEAISNKHIEY